MNATGLDTILSAIKGSKFPAGVENSAKNSASSINSSENTGFRSAFEAASRANSGFDSGTASGSGDHQKPGSFRQNKPEYAQDSDMTEPEAKAAAGSVADASLDKSPNGTRALPQGEDGNTLPPNGTDSPASGSDSTANWDRSIGSAGDNQEEMANTLAQRADAALVSSSPVIPANNSEDPTPMRARTESPVASDGTARKNLTGSGVAFAVHQALNAKAEATANALSSQNPALANVPASDTARSLGDGQGANQVFADAIKGAAQPVNSQMGDLDPNGIRSASLQTAVRNRGVEATDSANGLLRASTAAGSDTGTNPAGNLSLGTGDQGADDIGANRGVERSAGTAATARSEQNAGLPRGGAPMSPQASAVAKAIDNPVESTRSNEVAARSVAFAADGAWNGNPRTTGTTNTEFDSQTAGFVRSSQATSVSNANRKSSGSNSGFSGTNAGTDAGTSVSTGSTNVRAGELIPAVTPTDKPIGDADFSDALDGLTLMRQTREAAASETPSIARGSEGQFMQSSLSANVPARGADVQANSASTLLDLKAGPDTPDFPPELLGRIRMMQGQGAQEARLHLHPAELGRLQITISTDGDQTRVAFTVDNPQARDALENAMPRLRELLNQSGLQLAGSTVAQQGQQHSGEPAGGDQQTQGAVAAVTSDMLEDQQPQQLSPADRDQDRILDAYA